MNILLTLSAVLMVVTAAAHSWLGEKRIIGGPLRRREGYLADPFKRQLTRYAWHAMSGFVLANAATVAWPETPQALIRLVGALWIAIALIGLLATRGKHVGWPVIAGAGILAMIGA
ncbi:hypothetical protein [Novosphingobium sp.]|uniref:hypothetical protein n=1 Tax=Novosphingobium sp. TaxID=1874826 RepID=UPI00286E50DE|nr:hypothetical protein [Novosphingobium sp.]